MLQLIQDLRSGSAKVVEIPDPAVRPGGVLVRTTWSLISPGTEHAVSATARKSLVGKALDRPDQVRRVIDKAARDGVRSAFEAVQARLDDLLTPGYSSAGVVEAIGDGVSDVRVGDRVACIGANSACHAERVCVPSPLCLPLPPGLSDRWGAFAALGGIAAHGVRVAEVGAGSLVVVVGLGLVGQLTSQLVTAAGGRVVGVDLASERVGLAERLGAVAGAPPSSDVEGLVRSLTGGHGADAVIVAAASEDSGPIELAASVARDRAIVCVIGDVKLDVPRAPFYEKELQLRVSRSYGPGRYDPAYEEQGHDYPIGYVRWTERRLIRYFFEEVVAGRVRLEDLVTHEFPIARGVEAYQALEDSSRLAILLSYPTEAPQRTTRTPLGAPSAPTPGRLRAGIIGPGLFARASLVPQLRRLGVEVSAVVGPSSARAFGVARRWAARYVATSPDEMLEDRGIDMVVIATRHDSHAALATRALEHGKAVFLEKPLALWEDELAKLEELLSDGGRLVVDFNRSLAPSAQRAFAHFQGRTDPLHVHFRVNAGYLDASHWLRDPVQGGGRLVGEGCHFVDFCSAAVGQPLAGVEARAIGPGPTTLPGDSFVLTLSYTDGSLATVSYISSGSSRMTKERVEIVGAGRAAVIDDFRRLDLYGSGRRERSRRLRFQDKGHRAILSAALRFFREGGAPPIPYARLIETTRATFAARESLS